MNHQLFKERLSFQKVQSRSKNGNAGGISKLEAHAVLLLVLVAASTTFQNLPLHFTLFFWIIVPTVLMQYWLTHWDKWDAFLWSKCFSLMPVATCFITCCRYIGPSPEFVRLGSFVIMSVNIFEAAVKDVLSSKRGSWRQVNAISGVLLILAELPNVDTIRLVDKERRQILWELGGLWIIAYTIWNWMFIYNNYPYALGRHTIVLVAPLILALRDGWEAWAQARGYTLAFYFVIRNTYYEGMRSITDIDVGLENAEGQKRHRIAQVLSFISIISLLGYSSWTEQLR
jgi:hypothetical protein